MTKLCVPDTEPYPVCDHHDYQGMPEDLEALLAGLKETPAAVYKIAVTPQNTLDAMRLLLFAQKHAGEPLIVIGMGDDGQPTRILAPLFGAPWTYAALRPETINAPGQLTIQEMEETYRFSKLGRHTRFLGVMGDPVAHSRGKLIHNAYFDQEGIDAVYLSFRLSKGEAAHFLEMARQLPLGGLSVTMPLKQEVMASLDTLDEAAAAIGAVNTIVVRDSQLIGYNTDAPGALEALEEKGSVAGKQLVVLGAGGASKAIAYEARKRGAHVTVLNRTASKGDGPLSALGEIDYKILVNCTPAPMPINPDHLRPNTLIMDIVTRPLETELLKAAKGRGCETIDGSRMHYYQGKRQQELWFAED